VTTPLPNSGDRTLDLQTATTRVSKARRPGPPSLQATVVQTRPKLGTAAAARFAPVEPGWEDAPRQETDFEVELSTGIAHAVAHDFEDDDAFYAAATKRKRIKKAALALGVLAALWCLKVSFSSNDESAASVAHVRPVVEAPPQLPRVAAPAPAPAPTPAPTPVAVAAHPPTPEPTKPATTGKRSRASPPAVSLAAVVAGKTVASPSAVDARELDASPSAAAAGKLAEAVGTTHYFAAPPSRRPGPTRVGRAVDDDAGPPAGETADDAPPTSRPTALLWSVPGGAAVMVNGRYIGRTPLNVSWDVDGATQIELSLAGYDTKVLELTPASTSGLLKVTLAKSAEEQDPGEEEAEAPELAAPPIRVVEPPKGESVDKTRLPERNAPERAMPEPRRK